MSLTAVTNQPVPVWINGREYRIPKFSPRIMGLVEAWMRTQVPNPKEEARRFIEGLPDAVAIHIWTQACQEAKDWPPTFRSERGQALLLSFEGMAVVLHSLLSRTMPSLTLDEARDIAEQMTADDYVRVMKSAGVEYTVPPTIEDVADPKAG